MDKKQMIHAIIETAVNAAFLAGKHVDTTDMFFTLAFTSERKLKAICKKLNIAA